MDKLKLNLFRFLILPLGIFALILTIKNNLSFGEFAPFMVLNSFKNCLSRIEIEKIISKNPIKPKKCDELKGSLPIFFSDSNILYKGNSVVAIQGQESGTKKWYQVDTTDERYLKVVRYKK